MDSNSKFSKLYAKILSAQVFLAGLCMIAMMLHVTLDILSKHLLDMPLQGTTEVVSFYYMIPVFYFAMAYTESQGENICSDAIFQLFPRAMQSFLNVIIPIVGGALMLMIAWRAFGDAVHSFHLQEVNFGLYKLPVWPSRWILAISMLVAASAFWVRALQQALGHDEEQS